MFQSNVLFKAYSHCSGLRKRAWITKVIVIIQKATNLLLLAEGEGATATSLGQRPSGGGKIIIRCLKIIHRAPSVEGATATSLGNLILTNKYIKINRNKAPNGLSHCSNQTIKEV